MGEVPRSDLFDDVYFSAEDGPGETKHVFFDGNNLPARWQGRDRFVIGETGFGTGLNFLLAWDLFERTAEKGAFLDFVSVEKFPMSAEGIRKGLSPWAARLEPYLEKMLARYPLRIPGFHRIVFDNRVALTLIFGDANDMLAEVEGQVDAWFLDGFTPSKNPDMWTEKVFGEMARLSHAQTSFATFTAAGFVKRGLRAAGFTVEKRRGFGPKRDMLAGYFSGGANRVSKQKPRTAAIHGAGLAGCAAAHILPQYGITPLLYDPNGIASGASGNPVGLINPRFTAFRNAESDFYAVGFAQTAQIFPSLSGIGYAACGSLHLVMDEEKEKRFSRTHENWGWQDGQMQYLDAAAASDAAGMPVSRAALYLPSSAQVNPSALCHAYAAGLTVQGQKPRADAVILASGPAILAEIPGLRVHTVRGQITFARATPLSAAIKTNICYGGYISAARNGVHTIGSTFQKWMADTNPRDEDDAANLAGLAAALPAMGCMEIAGRRAALRVAAQDRFPLIGPAADRENIFMSTGHGSHGIVSTLMAAHILADYLRGGPFSVGKSTLNALSPGRFSLRAERKDAKKR